MKKKHGWFVNLLPICLGLTAFVTACGKYDPDTAVNKTASGSALGADESTSGAALTAFDTEGIGNVNLVDTIKKRSERPGQQTITDEEFERQLLCFAKHKDVWGAMAFEDIDSGEELDPEDEESDDYWTSVDISMGDFDQNGRLDLMISECMGSGQFTTYHVFEVSEDGEDIIPYREKNGKGKDPDKTEIACGALDVGSSGDCIPVYYDEQKGQYRYEYHDTLGGVGGHEIYMGTMSLKDGIMEENGYDVMYSDVPPREIMESEEEIPENAYYYYRYDEEKKDWIETSREDYDARLQKERGTDAKGVAFIAGESINGKKLKQMSEKETLDFLRPNALGFRLIFSEPSTEIKEQISYLAAHRDEWDFSSLSPGESLKSTGQKTSTESAISKNSKDSEEPKYGFTVTDLDGDGRLELQMLVCKEEFKEYYVTRVQEMSGNLDHLQAVGENVFDGFLQTGILYLDTKNNVKHYLCEQDTYLEYGDDGDYIDTVLYDYQVSDRGVLTWNKIRRKREKWSEKEWKYLPEAYYDGEGNEVSKETYEQIKKDYVKGMEKGIYYMEPFLSAGFENGYKDFTKKRLLKMSDERVEELLMESWVSYFEFLI